MYLLIVHVLFTSVCLVSPCPGGCDCSFSSEVFCANPSLSLTRIPTSPPGTMRLVVNNQNIERIYEEDFTGENVRGLEEIYLGSNNIQLIDDGAFEGLADLIKLYLTRNSISAVKEFAFSNLHNLQKLNLEGNSIETIACGAFRDLTDLTTLDLTGNSITALNESTFGGLHNLEVLILRDNCIDIIVDRAFDELGNLVSLVLVGNSISAVNAFTFSGLYNLDVLLLWNNTIDTIDADAFDDLRILWKLDLYDNNIAVIPDGIFSELLNLGILYLDGNPLLCDCGLKWLVEFIADRIVLYDASTCHSPDILEGITLDDLSDEDFANCQFNTTDTPRVTSMTNDGGFSTAQDPLSSVAMIKQSPPETSVQISPSVSPDYPIPSQNQPSPPVSPEQPILSLSTFTTRRQPSPSVSLRQSSRPPSTVDTPRTVRFRKRQYYMGLITSFLFGSALVALLMTLCLFLRHIKENQRPEGNVSSGGGGSMQMREHSNRAFETDN